MERQVLALAKIPGMVDRHCMRFGLLQDIFKRFPQVSFSGSRTIHRRPAVHEDAHVIPDPSESGIRKGAQSKDWPLSYLHIARSEGFVNF